MNVKPCRQRIKAKNSNVPIILVVEDDEDNLLFISQTLILLNYNFITANTGKDALHLATKYEIDLVILDLVLPDINGFEIISLLRQDKLAKNMPIIAISALARKQEIDRAFEAGCDDYLSKPYLIEDLEQKIRRYLASFFLKKTYLITRSGQTSYQLSAISSCSNWIKNIVKIPLTLKNYTKMIEYRFSLVLRCFSTS